MSNRLRAGAAAVEITPDPGTQLAGAVGRHRTAKMVLDPLYARAVVFEAGGRRLCLVALDVTIITSEYTEKIRRAAEAYDLAPEAVMVHATQTHSAPPIGHFMLDRDFPAVPDDMQWLRGGDEAYSEWAAVQAAQSIGKAVERLNPVEIAAASGTDGRWAANRRAVTLDGDITMVTGTWAEPQSQASVRYIEGPIDPEVGVLAVRHAPGDADTQSFNVPALILHHTSHPVCVFPQPVVSADWPGAWAAEMQKTVGEGCVPVVVNGACGNINPADRSDHRPMGAGLAETTRSVFQHLEFAGEAALDWRMERVPIPIREVTDEELEWCREVLNRHAKPPVQEDPPGVEREWIEAASTYSVYLQRQRSPELEYEIQALRIGDTAIVGLPGEPFAELGLAIKMASPAYPTFIA
ncbi:MAG: hypothetical protein R6V19_15490, partial [Armatimonadota bacterium]